MKARHFCRDGLHTVPRDAADRAPLFISTLLSLRLASWKGGGKSGWVPDAEFETACGSWILDLKLLVGPVMRWMCYITIVLDY